MILRVNMRRNASQARRKFIIWTPEFDSGNGGVIALHLLCARLNAIGEPSMVFSRWRPLLSQARSLHTVLRWIKWQLLDPWRAPFNTGPFGNPVAAPADLKNAIIIYPEIVSGNPLGGDRVVRWLLHKPGFHSRVVDYGADDLFFHYQDGFQDPAFPSTRLTVAWINDTYRDMGLPGRSGSAYLVRKGKGRPIVHDLENSVCVDDMSHEERALAFNRAEYFYTYDLYTMYSRYAAICGCIPIIVPDPAVSREQWIPNEEERYGLAYGPEDVPWARETRGKLFERMEREREEEAIMLRRFVTICRERFG
jgi:hypothetical protein